MGRRKHTIGRRTFDKALSRSADIIAAMRVMPLVKTQRHDGPTIWALQNGHEVAAHAARRLIEKGRIVPRDGGLLAGAEAQTFELSAEPGAGE